MADAAMIETPPTPEKQQLISEYLCLTGMQARINSGSDLERLAIQDLMEVVRANGPERSTVSITMFGTLSDSVFSAYKSAYAKHRDEFQRAYAHHLNWEFTEAELREIVAFLRTDTGRHYLDGDWRMKAYTNTNTEGLVASISAEAKTALRALIAKEGLNSPAALSLTEADLRAQMGVPDD